MTENQHGDGTAYHLGIDLGTTYVAAGILEQGRPEIITLGDRAPVLPSVLYFREDGEVLTGESASRRGLSDPTRVVREFKRRVGDTTPLVVGQTPYSVDVLMAKLVRFVHDAVVERQGAAPQVVAVTHPANWGPYKIDVLEQAVRIAGIGEVTTITEPVAAAIHYAAAERLDPGETVAVYDLGGGTFDAAVLRKTDHDFEVLGEVEGIERLGGIDFDEAVFQHVVRFCEPSLAELDVDDPAVIQALARLRQECVEAKEVLSTDTEVTIPVALPNLQTEVRLTRAEFEAMIRPLLRQTVDALRRAIGSADVEPAELSAVLLVGGCSRIPLISEMVGSELGRPIAVDRHPKHTVALGAAIAAGRSAQAPEPHVDDWFRTDPTSQDEVRSEPAAGPRGGVAAAAGAAAADLFSMFPLEEGAAGAEADPGGAGDRANPSPAAAEALRSPAERLGTTPVALAIPAASLLTAAVPANSKPTAAVPANSKPAAAVPASSKPAAAVPANSKPAAAVPTMVAGARNGPALSFSNTAIGTGPVAGAGAPGFRDHQLDQPGRSSRPGGRLLMLATLALAAFLVLGGTALALTRDDRATSTSPATDDGDVQVDGAEPVGSTTAPSGPNTAPVVDPAPSRGNAKNGQAGGRATGPNRTATTAGRTATTAGRTTTTARETTTTDRQTTSSTARRTTATHPTTTSTTEWPTTTTANTTTSTTNTTTSTTWDPSTTTTTKASTTSSTGATSTLESTAAGESMAPESTTARSGTTGGAT